MLWGEGVADQGLFGISLLPAGSLLSQKPPCVGVLGMMHDLIMVHVSWEKKPSGSLPTLPIPVPTDPLASPSAWRSGEAALAEKGPFVSRA